MKDLQQLMDFIASRYVFSADHYPGLAGLNSEQTKAFAINHSHLHMVKSLGRIAAECEQYDHYGSFDQVLIKEATVKIFIDTIKLAEELGMTADELCRAAPGLMRSK